MNNSLIRFESDYQEGCHPRILERLMETNMEQTSGYGVDPHCEKAKALIREFVGRQDAEVHFLVGGTQTNTTVIKSILRPYEGAVCLKSGHINVHESGAIESTGHKVLPLPARDGLLEAPVLKKYLEDFYEDEMREHTVQPGIVYISHPSEDGTLYSRRQLEEIHNVCAEYGLPLFLDGARLACGLVANGADLTIKDIANLCDVFYIGGTKCGTFFGEAVVLTHPGKIKNFRTLIKQQGGLLAKGRLLGIQFEVLFEKGTSGEPIYFELARHAVGQAMRLRGAFESAGISMLFDSITNQQFPILTDEQSKKLSRDFSFELWEKLDNGKSAYRFCTSWATKPENVDALIAAVKAL